MSLGPECLFQPDIQLGEIDAALGHRIAQLFHDGVAVGVGSTQLTWPARLRRRRTHLRNCMDTASCRRVQKLQRDSQQGVDGRAYQVTGTRWLARQGG